MNIDKKVRFYPSIDLIRSQKSQILTIGIMFIVSIVIALSLKNQAIKTFLLFASLVYPAVIVLSILSVLPRFNYTELDDKSICLTRLKFLHKRIDWSEIQKLEETSYFGIHFIGILFKPTTTYQSFGSGFRKKNTGFDVLIQNRHQKDGTSLASAATQLYDLHSQS
jgi:hypothetical protein